MDNDLIDDDFLPKNKKRKIRFSHWIAAIFLWLGLLLCLFSGIIDETKVIGGVLCLIPATVFTYFRPNLGLKLMLVPLFLGTLNFLTFYPFKIYSGLEIGVIGVHFELLLFILTVVHIYYNNTILTSFLVNIIQNEDSKDVVEAKKIAEITRFKRKFSAYSKNELSKIAENDKMVSAARIAASELLDEKSNF